MRDESETESTLQNSTRMSLRSSFIAIVPFHVEGGVPAQRRAVRARIEGHTKEVKIEHLSPPPPFKLGAK